MTVKELIEELQKYPEDTKIVVGCWGDGWYYTNFADDVSFSHGNVLIDSSEA